MENQFEPSQSEGIEKLAAALCECQKEPLFALTTSENPFFKSKYADLSSIWDVAREPLTKNGLSVVQTMDYSEGGEPIIITTLMHTSGQWIRGRLLVKLPKSDPQTLGSCITYGRRYSLSAILGICPEDDDAEGTMVRKKKAKPKGKPKAKAKPKPQPQPDPPIPPPSEQPPLVGDDKPNYLTQGQAKAIIKIASKLETPLSEDETTKVIDWYCEHNEHGGRTFEAGQALIYGFSTILDRYMDFIEEKYTQSSMEA